jgi:threonylcarbamoyladenosine tRNA methylthiotransferase MtaB
VRWSPRALPKSLTGVDITGYGGDLPGRPGLGQLCRRLLALVPELHRLRLSSIDIAEADADLWALLADEIRLLPHLHLSLQSGDDLILKRMKRRHTRRQAIDFCRRARDLRPDIAFGADLIAGFPTETEAMFQRTLELVEEAGIAFSHVFQYSARRGTPAARMPQVPAEIRHDRARRLRQAGDRSLRDFLERRRGADIRLLVEESDGDFAKGHSDEFAPTHLVGAASRPGEVIRATVTGLGRGHWIAEAA